MNAPAPSITFTDYPGMVEAFRAIKEHLGLSNTTVDVLCNFGQGHTDKLLGPTSARGFAPLSINSMLWAFAIRGSFTIDLERAREMEAYWEQRCVANTRQVPNRISKVVVERAKPHVMKQTGRFGGLVTAHMRTPAQRSESARKAANSRWKKHRRAKRALREKTAGK